MDITFIKIKQINGGARSENINRKTVAKYWNEYQEQQ